MKWAFRIHDSPDDDFWCYYGATDATEGRSYQIMRPGYVVLDHVVLVFPKKKWKHTEVKN